jgi:hypothetical protein
MKPIALDTLRKDGEGFKVKLGGMVQGKFVHYATKSNAIRAVDNYYSEDFQKYRQNKYPKLCLQLKKGR